LANEAPWSDVVVCVLFLSIISMCEFPSMPRSGRSTTSTAPPAFP